MNYTECFGECVNIELARKLFINFLMRNDCLKDYVKNSFLFKESHYDEETHLFDRSLKHNPSKEEIIDEIENKLKLTAKSGYFKMANLMYFYSGSFNWKRTSQGHDYWLSIAEKSAKEFGEMRFFIN